MIPRALLRTVRLSTPITRPICHAGAARPPLFPPLSTVARQPVTSRWYSVATETDKPTEGGPQTSDAATGEKTSKEVDPAKEELESKNREIVSLKDKYLRSVADFRNLQDRTQRDVHAARDFAIQRFAKDLIDSVDNLDRALSTVPETSLKPSEKEANTDLVNLYDGLRMTETILMQTLEKHGLKRFDPSVESEPFNPNLHEATFQTPVDGKEDGTVMLTQQKGFTLNGRVLRAAKVGVVKNS